MTQDPWGQPRPAGYVVRGEVVPDSESGASGAGQAPPMTHFQKVASALRGDQPAQPADQSEEPVSTDEDEARTEEVRAVSSPDNGRDYWDVDGVEDEPAEDPAASATEDPVASVTEDTAASASARPADAETAPSVPAGLAEDEPGDEAGPDAHDATDPSMTQPDIFGTPRPTAASIPTVPIALTEEPDGAAGRHAAAAAPGVTAAEAATSAEAGQAEAAPVAAAQAAAPSAVAAPAVAAAAAAPAAEAELRPGESGTMLGRGESGYASLITDSADLRTQWHRIQYKFVDDPHASVSEAADVLAQVAARLEAAIAERQRGLRGRWDTTSAADTETLRETLRMYRTFLDQLIGPEPS